MRDKVIALENESDRVVSVCIPVAIFELLCGFAVDDKVARGVRVQAADDVQQRGFTAARVMLNTPNGTRGNR